MCYSNVKSILQNTTSELKSLQVKYSIVKSQLDYNKSLVNSLRVRKTRYTNNSFGKVITTTTTKID